ncbi:MAG: hypothetical protein LBV18_06335 [Alistipes sp.]|jgi:hypothetical protein|nr:hypothetical protein [Alistipes sp.]
MKVLLDIFSTRELVLIIWLAVLFVAFLIWDKHRFHLKNIAKAAFAPGLVFSYLSLLIYASALVFILWRCGFWDISLLKDTIIWFLFTAIGVFFGLDKVRDGRYFWRLFKSTFASTVFVEFFANLYSFSLSVEILLFPCVFTLTILSVYSEHSAKTNEAHKKVNSCFNVLLGLIGLLYLGFSIYKTVIEFGSVLWVDVLTQFMLPIFLTILSIPCFWILALWMKYEMMFVANNVLFRDRNTIERLKIKFFILYYGHFSFNRVHRIWKKLALLAFEENVSCREYIKQVSSAPAYKKQPIVNKMRIGLFNDINACRQKLTSLGLGEFSEWDKLHGFDEFYCSPSYYKISPHGLSNLLLSLQGKEFHIHKLELTLSIYSSEKKDLAVQKFTECISSIFEILSLQLPSSFPNPISRGENYTYANDEYSVSLTFEINGQVESVNLLITSN